MEILVWFELKFKEFIGLVYYGVCYINSFFLRESVLFISGLWELSWVVMRFFFVDVFDWIRVVLFLIKF